MPKGKAATEVCKLRQGLGWHKVCYEEHGEKNYSIKYRRGGPPPDEYVFDTFM
jgi:hypothetical protein